MLRAHVILSSERRQERRGTPHAKPLPGRRGPWASCVEVAVLVCAWGGEEEGVEDVLVCQKRRKHTRARGKASQPAWLPRHAGAHVEGTSTQCTHPSHPPHTGRRALRASTQANRGTRKEGCKTNLLHPSTHLHKQHRKQQRPPPPANSSSTNAPFWLWVCPQPPSRTKSCGTCGPRSTTKRFGPLHSSIPFTHPTQPNPTQPNPIQSNPPTHPPNRYAWCG